MNYQISITQKCNLRCSYCYEIDKNYYDCFDMETAQKVCLFIVNDFSKRGTDKSLGVNITGGEPLLHFDIVAFIINELESKVQKIEGCSLFFEISTNGMVLDQQKIVFLNKSNISLFIGTDGARITQNETRRTKNDTDSFEIVTKNLKLLFNTVDLKFKNIILNMVVTPKTVKRMYLNYKYLLSLSNESEISINPALEENWTKMSLKTYRSQLRKVTNLYYKLLCRRKSRFDFLLIDKQASILLSNFHKPFTINACRAGIDTLAITTDGSIIPCAGFLYNEHNVDTLCLGNITTGVDETKVNNFRDSIHFDLNQCKYCDFVTKCIYYCPSNNLKTTGNMDIASYSICEISKSNIKETERFLERLAKRNTNVFFMKYINGKE